LLNVRHRCASIGAVLSEVDSPVVTFLASHTLAGVSGFISLQCIACGRVRLSVFFIFFINRFYYFIIMAKFKDFSSCVHPDGNDVGDFRLNADRRLLDFLRPRHESRFTRMDAYCYLLDKALENYRRKASDASRDKVSDAFFKDMEGHDGSNSEVPGNRNRQPVETPFEVTVLGLSQAWNWHRNTVRNFLDDLAELGRMERHPLVHSYAVALRMQPDNDDMAPVDTVSDGVGGQVDTAGKDASDDGIRNGSVAGDISRESFVAVKDFNDIRVSVEDLLHVFFTKLSEPVGVVHLENLVSRPKGALDAFVDRFVLTRHLTADGSVPAGGASMEENKPLRFALAHLEAAFRAGTLPSLTEGAHPSLAEDMPVLDGVYSCYSAAVAGNGSGSRISFSFG
jgi:hypothetical protein